MKTKEISKGLTRIGLVGSVAAAPLAALAASPASASPSGWSLADYFDTDTDCNYDGCVTAQIVGWGNGIEGLTL